MANLVVAHSSEPLNSDCVLRAHTRTQSIMKRSITVILVLCLVLAGVAVYFTSRSTSNSLIHTANDAALGTDSVNLPQTTLNLRSYPHDLVADTLTRASELNKLALPEAMKARAEDDAIKWIGASFAEDHNPMMRMMQQAGVELWPSLHNDPGAFNESWRQSRENNLLSVAFDPSRSSAMLIDASAPSPFPSKLVQRCSRRDTARPFLSQTRDPQARDMVVQLEGTLQEDQTVVTLAYRFAWNKEAQQWVLIQICLFDYPNQKTVFGMML
jgi:hypothetical protein